MILESCQSAAGVPGSCCWAHRERVSVVLLADVAWLIDVLIRILAACVF